MSVVAGCGTWRLQATLPILPASYTGNWRRAPTCPLDSCPGSAAYSGVAQRPMARLYLLADASLTGGHPARSAPSVGGLRGSHQRVAQFAQFGWPGSFVERCGNIFCRASHLVDAVGQVGSLVGGEHHGVRRQRRSFTAVDRGPLLVGTLPAGLPAVLAAPAHPAIGHVTTTPAARLWSNTTGHGADFSRGDAAIPVSWMVESHRELPRRPSRCQPGENCAKRILRGHTRMVDDG